MRVLSFVVLASLAAPLTALTAQEQLDSGSVVRVQPAAGARWRTGRVHRVAADTLWIANLGAPDGRNARPVVASPERARLEVSPDYDAISRRRHRVIAGAGVVMALFAISANRAENAPFTTSPLVAGLAGFGAGVLGGTLASEALYPRRWQPVER